MGSTFVTCASRGRLATLHPAMTVALENRPAIGTQSGSLEAQPSCHSTKSVVFRRALEDIERMGRHPDVIVLLEGESGTGKGYLARHLHDCSPRAREAFHILVLSALDEGVASSELFGHVTGAYTDARQPRVGRLVSAARGTVLLDEIGKASLGVQRKLLHAIEHREVWPVGSDRSVRVAARMVAASNVPLELLVERGEFLEDLHARFGFFRVRVPALRERRADIPDLVRHFLHLLVLRFGYASPPAVDEDLMRALQDAEWPHNVRELDSAVQRLLVNAEHAGVLTLRHCTGPLAHLRSSPHRDGPLTHLRAKAAMAAAGDISKAARALGVARSTVQRALKRPAELPPT